MVSVLTGICLGVAMGTIAGEGMDVVRDSKGRRRIKGIDLKQGFEKASEGILPVALMGASILGTAVVCEVIGEDIKNVMEAKEEECENKREELLLKTDNLIDEVIDMKLHNQMDRYLKVSNIIKQQDKEQIFNISTDTLEDMKELNSFEMYGLSCMTEEQIKQALMSHIKIEAEKVREDVKEVIREGSLFELEVLEKEIDMLSNHQKDFMETDLF